jgi:hypothetical protein
MTAEELAKQWLEAMLTQSTDTSSNGASIDTGVTTEHGDRTS